MSYFGTRTLLSLHVAVLALAVFNAPQSLAVTAADLQVGKWVAVSSNSVASVSACPNDACNYSGSNGISGVMDDWNGGAFASNLGAAGSLLVFGGGHSGYFGNEVYAFDVAQGAWSRLTNPVSPPTCDFSTSTMAGNSPCVPHTYDSLEYSPITNEFVKLGSSADNETVLGTPYVHALNLQTKQWRRGARMPTWGATISDDGEGASSAWDSVRNVLWWHGAWRAFSTSDRVLRKYDPVANTWTEYPGANVNIDHAMAFDSQRQILLVVDGRVNQSVYAYDTSVATPVKYKLSTTGDLTLQQTYSVGLEYDPVTDQFVGWNGGSVVYTLKAPADWKTGTWTWKAITAASGSASPTANPNGTFGRFRYVPALNAFIVVNSVSAPTYMYKLSAGGGAPATGNPPTASLSASPNSLAAGGTTTLSWSSLDATSCTAAGAWSGSKSTTGSESVGPLNATATYTLNCSGSGGSVSRSATVQVVTSGPTISLAASPATIAPNGSTVVSWSASNATSCTASGSWSGSKAVSGSQTVGPLSASGTYTLSCTGSGGTNQRSAIVTVQDQTQTNNFQARCTGPGVLRCVGFDSAADFSSTLLFPDGNGQIRGSMDSNVKASGDGSLRFEIPSNSPANTSGYWLGSLGKDFGPGDTMYLQFRQRFSEAFLNTDYAPGGGWKQFILHTAGIPSCTTLQFVMVNRYLTGFPIMYGSCGSAHLEVELPDGDNHYQQGDVDCRRRDTSGCKRYVADRWMTFYLKFSLADFGSPSTHLEAWMADEGEPLVQILDIPDFPLDYQGSPSERLNVIQITPYQTGKDASQVHPVAFTWYDELIVSTQPIPAPNGIAPPPTATPPTVTLAAEPASVSSGGTTTLNWSTTNAENCTASGGWSGTKSISGSAAVGPINQATSFTLQCFNSVGDSDSRTVQVTVGQTPPPLPEISFYADPASVELGNSSMVFWSVTNAFSCVGEQAWSGDKGTVGSEPMFLSATRTYDLVCTGNGGTSRKAVTIEVVSPGQPTLTLRADSLSVQQGSTGALTWSSTNVNSCQANGAWTGARSSSGVETVGPLAATSTFMLVCTGPGGTVEAAAQIAVTAPPDTGSGGGSTGGGTGDPGDTPAVGSTSGGTMATGPLELALAIGVLFSARRRSRRAGRQPG